MSLSQFFSILRARWALGLAVWVGIFAVVVGLTNLATPQFTSTAVVLVDNRAGNITGAVGSGDTVPGYMATQVDVAQSARVIRRAITSIHLAENAELRATWLQATGGRGDYMAWISGRLLSKYVVRPSRDSSALTLAYSATDAQFAATVTNALTQAYIDTSLELRVEPAKQYNAFFDDRSRQMRDALEQAQNKLSAYQRQNGLLSSDERFDVENARLQELSSQMVMMQGAFAESSGRQAEAGANPQSTQEVLSNGLVSSLSADASRQEAKLKELKSRLGDNNPQVIEAEANIAELRSRLQTALTRASASAGVTNNIVRGRYAQAQQALEQQRLKVLQLKAKRDEAGVMQRDVESAQHAYDQVLARTSQTDLESQNRQANVSVLEFATPSPFPSAPKVSLNAAAGFLLGLLLGIGVILMREISDRRLRTEFDVTHVLNQPILILLPHVYRQKSKKSIRLSHMKSRVLDGLPKVISVR